jgi:hypothetical protein
MKITYKLIVAEDINTFEQLVDDYLEQGYRFIAGNQVMINKRGYFWQDRLQYSVSMILEGEQTNG